MNDETPQDESFSPEFPETVIFASFTDLPLTKISAQTEMVASYSNILLSQLKLIAATIYLIKG